MKYVSVLWSDYHNLSAITATAAFASQDAANNNCVSASDKILSFFDDEIADEYVEQFKALCYAAWTPNQSESDKESNGGIISNAQARLEMLESAAIINISPYAA